MTMVCSCLRQSEPTPEQEFTSVGSVPLNEALQGDVHADREEQVKKSDGSWGSVMTSIADAVDKGSVSATTTMNDLGKKIASGAKVSAEEMSKFFSSLAYSNKAHKKKPKPGSAVSIKLPSEASLTETEASDASFLGSEERRGVPMVDYRNFPLKGYVDVPSALVSLLQMASMDHYLIIGRPTMAPSAGLEGYRSVTTKEERASAPFIVVIDTPGKLETYQDKKYIWVEFALGDTFMLDVSGMKSMEDYGKVLTKKGRWNLKDRQKKFQSGPILHEFIDFPKDEEFIASLWPLYSQTGEKNGFTVLTKDEFFEFHRSVPDLVISIAWDVTDPEKKKMISFCTGVAWNDVIMPMWCGTDYENDLNRSCATYFNILYSYVDWAIKNPKINWVDLGASHRKAKTAIGFQPYPSSGYFRCKTSFMSVLVESMMDRYYEPERLINDP